MDLAGFIKRTKIKQKELAELLGISVPMVTALKQGRTDTTATVCEKLLRAGMTVEELFGRDIWEKVKRQAEIEMSGVEFSDEECRSMVHAALSSAGLKIDRK